MTTIVLKVGSASTGRDFATEQAAIDSIPKMLTGTGNNYYVACYPDSEFARGTQLRITGFSCSQTENITLGSAAGTSIVENPNAATNPIAYDPSKGPAIRYTGEYNAAIYSDANYLVIEGLQIKGNSYSAAALELHGTGNIVRHCDLDATPQPGSSAVIMTGISPKLINTPVLNRAPNTNGVIMGDGGIISGCTIASPAGYVANAGVVSSGTTCTLENTGIFGFGTAVYGNWTGSNNATDCATIADGSSNSLTSLVYADQFVSVTNATMDLRKKTGSAMINAGKTTAYTKSINGITRPSGPSFDIGADEFPLPATAIRVAGSATGYSGTASTLTFSPNGTITGPIVVTPSDNGAGGTFNPPTVTLTSAAPSQTSNYTAASVGAKSITATNNGGLANPSAFTFTATLPPPSGAVTSQPAPDGGLVVTFSTANNPTSGQASLATPANGSHGALTTPGVVAIGTNTGTATFSSVPVGTSTLTITLTNASGVPGSVTGTQPVVVVDISGDVQAPDPSPDTSAPTITGAAVANSLPTVVALTSSETLDSAYTPAASAFTVAGHTVSGVALAGQVINLTVTPAFANGETARTASYTQPSTGGARDPSGNLMVSFTARAITNNVAAPAPSDTTAPTITAAAVADNAPGVVVLTASEALDATKVPATSAFTVAGHTVNNVAVAGSAISLTVTPAFAYGEAARVAGYTQPSSNGARDSAGNLLASFSARAITNNVAAPVQTDTTPPTITAAAVADNAPTTVVLTASEALDSAFVPVLSAFTVSGRVVTAVAVSGSSINLTVTPAFAYGEAARTVAYAQPSTGGARDTAGNLLASFSARAITNNVAPPVVTEPGFTRSKVRTIKVKAAPLTFEGTAFWDMRDAKRPVGSIDKDATIDISFDWTDVLSDIMDTIDHIQFDIDGLTSLGGFFVGGFATIFVTAPTEQPRITCRITSKSVPARVEDRTVFLKIEAE